MKNVEYIPNSYEDAARTLAHWHNYGEASPRTIYQFHDPERREVRLIEVGDDVPATGEVQVFALGPTEQFPFPSAVVLVTPEEWEQIKRGDLKLPEGWRLDDYEPLPGDA